MNANSNTGEILVRIGIWMQAALVVSIGFIVWAMMRAAGVLGSPSAADAAQLAVVIGDVLTATSIGITLGLAGCMLLIIAITACRYRSRWLFWFLVTFGLLCTPFGIFFLIFCLIKRDEFLPPIQLVAA